MDILYVVEDEKPVARIFSDEENKILDFLNEKNLHYTLSDYKILLHTDKTRGYSDKGIRVKKNDKRKNDLKIIPL